MIKFLAGIDEAGRGPLAGPVAVGVCIISTPFSSRNALSKRLEIFGIRDSKKLSEKKREEIFEKLQKLKKEKKIDFHVALISEKIIDRKGINEAIRIGIKRCLEKVAADAKNTRVLLDGGIYAPKEFKNQETIIKGDDKEPVISLASICAKVVRDRKMVLLSKKFPRYGFEIHKGYGTKTHRKNIKKFNLSSLHRKSFCRNFAKKLLAKAS